MYESWRFSNTNWHLCAVFGHPWVWAGAVCPITIESTAEFVAFLFLSAMRTSVKERRKEWMFPYLAAASLLSDRSKNSAFTNNLCVPEGSHCIGLINKNALQMALGRRRVRETSVEWVPDRKKYWESHLGRSEVPSLISLTENVFALYNPCRWSAIDL